MACDRSEMRMPTVIQEVQYFSHNEVADRVGVDRTTLWRWRKEGEVPQGRRFRGNVVLFTEAELRVIEDYAFRMEPIDPADPDQIRLFDTNGGHR